MPPNSQLSILVRGKPENIPNQNDFKRFLVISAILATVSVVFIAFAMPAVTAQEPLPYEEWE